MKTLTSRVESARIGDSIRPVWLITATFDSPGQTTLTRRIGSRAFTLGGNDYLDQLIDNGIRLGEVSLKSRGGLASVAGCQLSFADLSGASIVGDTYVLEGDEVIVHCLLDGMGAVEADRVEVYRGVVERYNLAQNRWTVSLRDDSTRLLRPMPREQLTPDVWPLALNPGETVPLHFGSHLAPLVVTDAFAGPELYAGRRFSRIRDVYQWYEQPKLLARCPGAEAQDDGTITFSSPARVVTLRPFRDKINNDIADWINVTDGNPDTTVTVMPGQTLSGFFPTAGDLGFMTSLRVISEGVGPYVLRTFDDDVVTSFRETGRDTITLNMVLDTWRDWETGLMNFEITTEEAGGITIQDVRLEISFDDFADTSGDRFFADLDGYADQAANYQDGAVISAAGLVLYNPVRQLRAIMRDTDALGMESSLLVSGFDNAEASRDGWRFDFSMERSDSASFLNEFLFQAGLAMFPKEQGFALAALDETREPQMFFSGDWHSPADNALQPLADRWQSDLTVEPTTIDEVINEFQLRYGWNPASQRFTKVRTASGAHRLTGMATVTRQMDGSGLMTDSSGDFVNDDVVAGERVWIVGDSDYTVVSVQDAQNLVVRPIDGGEAVTQPALEYFLGPNLDGRMKASQLAFRAVRALGRQQTTFTDQGGYESRLIQDDQTAGFLLDYVARWFSTQRYRLRKTLSWIALPLEAGDVFLYDDPGLPASVQPVMIGNLAADAAAGDTTWTVDDASLWRDDDYVLIRSGTREPEVARVADLDFAANTLTVTRGILGTRTLAHSDGDTLYRMQTRWLCTAARPMQPGSAVVPIRAEQTPYQYRPIGRVTADGFPDYSGATPAQRLQSGWATFRSGRVDPADEDSELSHVG